MKKSIRMICRQLYDKPYIVRLHLCVVRRLIPSQLSAFQAFMYYYISALGIRQCGYRLHQPAAVAAPITWVYVEMERIQAERAVVSRRVAEGKHFFSAVATDKARIVF